MGAGTMQIVYREGERRMLRATVTGAGAERRLQAAYALSRFLNYNCLIRLLLLQL